MSYIFYVKVNGEIAPIKCEGYLEDQFLEGYARLFGVEGITEGLYPDLSVETLTVKKENIDYYLSGTHKEIEEEASNENQEEEYSEEESEEEPEQEPEPEKPKSRRRRSRF